MGISNKSEFFLNSEKEVFNKYLIPLIFLLLLIICFNFLANIFNSINSPFDPDEWQHLHIAWNVFNGKIIYKDFFEHHGCVYPFLNSAIFTIFNLKPDLQTISIIRDTNLIYSLLILFLTYAIAKEISGSFITSILSVTLLSCLIFYQDTTIQIRPDGLQNVFWLVGTLMIVKNINFERYFLSFGGGFFISLSVLTNSKALVGPASIILYFILLLAFKINNKKIIIKNCIYFIIGFCVPYIIISIYFILNHAFGNFLFFNYEFNVVAAFEYSSKHVKEYIKFFGKNETLFYLFSLIGIIYFIIAFKKGKSIIYRNNKHFFLLVITLVTCSGALIGLYSQFYLIFLPLLSIIVSILIINIFRYLENKNAAYKLGYTIIVLLLFIQILNSKINNTYFTSSKEIIQQKEQIDYMLTNTKRSEPILFIWCKWGGYVFNSDLQFFWFENENFKSYYKKICGYDVYGDSLIKKLREKNVKYIIGYQNKISSILSKNAYDYVMRNYRKCQNYDGLWIRI